MKLEYALLGLLSRRPYSGYDLSKWLETEGRFLRDKAHHSQIYRLLGRMVRDGWVEFDVDPREGRPDAKVYRLTDLGRTALLDWAKEEYRPSSRFQRSEFLLRFAFAGPVAPETLVPMVRTELAYRRDQVARNRDRDRTVAVVDPVPELDVPLTQKLADLSHDYGTRAVDVWIDWLERVLARLEAPSAADATRIGEEPRA
ncbi:DNA-binding PadR family transcriptional regulator [Spinactinospora alkalitolerans]|uniref:DNA-binding PadR family transcriptional regulator n=1 Tax=Spinactinospora alkalitolerans TaxID=687207 RepID=A0A852U5I4_9ACTN|nr:helix-turn-helix transcriptional regulator [Spinactinospora alkalitolerans]NYE50762.1 DNA-binding PadR family transcriptional regulator [Spinactinospora alkalitolerans]